VIPILLYILNCLVSGQVNRLVDGRIVLVESNLREEVFTRMPKVEWGLHVNVLLLRGRFDLGLGEHRFFLENRRRYNTLLYRCDRRDLGLLTTNLHVHEVVLGLTEHEVVLLIELIVRGRENAFVATQVQHVGDIPFPEILCIEGLLVDCVMSLALVYHALVLDLLEGFKDVILFRNRAIKQLEGVHKQGAFHHLVEFGVDVEGWRVVDLDEVSTAFIVKHDVEAKNLEAHVVVNVAGLAGAVAV